MKKVVGKSFTGKTMPLDDHHYEDCKFQSCTFTFSATSGFGLTNNRISEDCVIRLNGSAAKTMAAMKALYDSSNWGRNMIVATFERVAPKLHKLH